VNRLGPAGGEITSTGYPQQTVFKKLYDELDAIGGTIVIGLLAVYTLMNFSTLPIFLGSTAIATLALWLAKRRTLIYGRDEFVLALLAGSLLPASVFLYVYYLPVPIQAELLQSVFIGSLLSGIAAFNLHQVRPGHRTKDLIGSIGIYVGLLALGALLVGPSTRFLAEYTPLVLFSATSDIALWRDAVVAGPADPAFVGRPLMIGVFALTLGLAEYVRTVYAVHIGAIAMGLLAIYTVSTWRLPALFLLTTVVVFALVTAIHRSSILYGRALLSTGAALGMVAAVPIAHDETVHGVLSIVADDPTAFDQRATAILTELGRSVGYAISVLERSRALESDTTTELAFTGSDDGLLFVRERQQHGERAEHLLAGDVEVGTDVVEDRRRNPVAARDRLVGRGFALGDDRRAALQCTLEVAVELLDLFGVLHGPDL
jgi:hypothetical protein